MKMNRRSTALIGMPLLIGLIGISLLNGCGGERTRVVDASGKPVSDAVLSVVYPSYAYSFPADKDGVIHYSKTWANAISVSVSSETSGSILLQGYPAPGIIVLDGKRWEDQFKTMWSLKVPASEPAPAFRFDKQPHP